MKRSTDRFLTTHTGSLPRPADLIRMMFAREEGVPVDAAALAARIRAAVAEVVGKQVAAGIDVVNDGELSKPSYATYVKDRLHGSAARATRSQYQDLVDFPELAKRVFGDPGRARRQTPACDGPISVRDPRAPRRPTPTTSTRRSARHGAEGFLTRRVARRHLALLPNNHYPSHEAYLVRHRRRHARRVRDHRRAPGFVLQIDCPDLAMGRHIQFADLSLEEFRKMARLHVEALNHALANIPPEQAALARLLGQLRGPAQPRRAAGRHPRHRLGARGRARISFEAANPRHAHEWTVFEQVKLPAGKVLIPGVIDSTTNYIEHPELVAQRIGRYARLVGRENVIAGTDCGFGTWVGQAARGPRRRLGQAGQPGRGRAARLARVLVAWTSRARDARSVRARRLRLSAVASECRHLHPQ